MFKYKHVFVVDWDVNIASHKPNMIWKVVGEWDVQVGRTDGMAAECLQRPVKPQANHIQTNVNDKQLQPDSV